VVNANAGSGFLTLVHGTSHSQNRKQRRGERDRVASLIDRQEASGRKFEVAKQRGESPAGEKGGRVEESLAGEGDGRFTGGRDWGGIGVGI